MDSLVIRTGKLVIVQFTDRFFIIPAGNGNMRETLDGHNLSLWQTMVMSLMTTMCMLRPVCLQNILVITATASFLVFTERNGGGS